MEGRRRRPAGSDAAQAAKAREERPPCGCAVAPLPLHPAGIAELERARADGRSKAAYAGSASIEVPPDLEAALAAEPKAHKMFEKLSRQNRYAILYRIGTAKRVETRERRITQFVEMLSRGETVYPQERT